MNIIVRSSWQTVNIGDISHSPGVIRILEENIPDCKVTLWASEVSEAVKMMINSRFSDVKIIKGKISDGDEEFLAEIDNCDFLLHGSGPSFVAYNDVKEFTQRTGKPFGIFGITCDTGFILDNNLKEQKWLLDKASFIFYRDTKSLECAKANGINAPIMKFGCDGAFAFDIIDEVKAAKTLKKYNLEEGRFVCCIPRNRYTPYWKVKSHVPYNKERDEYNNKMADTDNAPLRNAIVKIIENTDLKVFICPEDETQVELGREIINDKLPDNIKDRVALKREYWLTDEAVGVYRKSAGLFGCEMHSPIMCIGNGVPAIVARWKEQTTKGYMFADLGMGDWLFDFDSEEDKKRFPSVVLETVKNRAQSIEKALRGKERAFATYKYMCQAIINAIKS